MIKSIVLFFLTIVSCCLHAQVESVELLPESLFGLKGEDNFSATLNEKQDRLCFVRSPGVGKDEKIMISDKAKDGTWLTPYQAVHVSNRKAYFRGVRLSASGKRIYFAWDNDIHFVDHLGGNKWSLPKLIAEAGGAETMELDPQISQDENTLIFLRNVRDTTGDDWSFKPFVCVKRPDKSWSVPRRIVIENFNERIWRFATDNKMQMAFFFSGEGKSEFNNYFAALNDTICTDVTRIDLAGGIITWISDDLTNGLVATNTKPFQIASIRFAKPLRSPANTTIPVVNIEAVKTETSTAVKPLGKYYALLIGVSNYNDTNLNLRRPSKDVLTLKEILTLQYAFEPSDIKLLTDPTRQQIISELYKLRTSITPNDNLLIFYAGHGFWDEHIRQGYWWPRDANAQDPSFWLSNSDLREQIRGIHSGHTLLISDACFAGGIFRARGTEELRTAPKEIQVLYRTRSRRAITSGNLSTVPDESVFFEYFTKRLRENTEKYVPSQMLFNNLRLAVINNSMNIPQEGVITDAGDEGGDFIFIKRD